MQPPLLSLLSPSIRLFFIASTHPCSGLFNLLACISQFDISFCTIIIIFITNEEVDRMSSGKVPQRHVWLEMLNLIQCINDLIKGSINVNQCRSHSCSSSMIKHGGWFLTVLLVFRSTFVFAIPRQISV